MIQAGDIKNMTKTISRNDLASAVHQQIGLSFNESTQLVVSVFDELAACLESGEAVKISSFGTFIVILKRARIGRNPKTGARVPIMPRKILNFRPSVTLKARVNGG